MEVPTIATRGAPRPNTSGISTAMKPITSHVNRRRPRSNALNGCTADVARAKELARALAAGSGELAAQPGEPRRIFTQDGDVQVPGFAVEEVDPTGAGDTFAGGFMGYLASQKEITEETLRRAMIYGSVMASYTLLTRMTAPANPGLRRTTSVRKTR